MEPLFLVILVAGIFLIAFAPLLHLGWTEWRQHRRNPKYEINKLKKRDEKYRRRGGTGNGKNIQC